jgi:hypothetical protein
MRLRTLYIFIACAALALVSCQKDLSYEGTPLLNAGDFRAEIDGVQWIATDSAEGASFLGGMINISGISSDNRQLSITLNDTVTGVYVLNQSSASLAAYADLDSSDIYAFTTNQGTDTSEAGGMVDITAIDKIGKTLTGTFSFKAYRDIDGHQKNVTQGVFYQLSYTTSLPVASTADTMQVTIDGTPWAAQSIEAAAISSQTVITGSTLSGTPSVSLLLPVNVVPGPYTLDVNTETNYIGIYNPMTTIALPSTEGTLTILENNPTTRRVRGNFQFRASDPTGMNPETDSLSNGYFSVQHNP